MGNIFETERMLGRKSAESEDLGETQREET